MGKPIVYCEVCGKSISAESILLNDAILVQSSYYCKDCAEKLNIKGSNKKVLKKPFKKKIDIDELPDISIQKVQEEETFFTRHKKEFTYALYSFSIFIIIFSALFIIYRYALSKPTIKDLSAQKCKEIQQLIQNSSFDSKSSYISVIDRILKGEDILKGSECEENVFMWKKQAQQKVTEMEEQEQFLAKLQEIENTSDPLSAIQQVDILYNDYSNKPYIWTNDIRARFQDTRDLVVSKLWEQKKKEISSEYLNSPYSLEDYIAQLNEFATKYIENNKYVDKYIVNKKSDKIREISSFKDRLKSKFEEKAEEYKNQLISKLSQLIKEGKCEEAEKGALNFSPKYIGTAVYKTKNELIQHIKENCKKEDIKEEPTSKSDNVDKQDNKDIVIYPYDQQKQEESTPSQPPEPQIRKKEGEIQSDENQDESPPQIEKKENKKYVLFNGKDKNGWVEINKNANWKVWYGSLYGALPVQEKNSAIIYFSKKSFKNFSLSFKYRLMSGYFFVCFRMSPEKPSEKLSFIYLNNYNRTDTYAEFSAKVFNNVAVVKAPKGDDGSANFNEESEEGFIGFMLSNGAEVYFKDIEVEEITQTEEELKGAISVPLFNGKDLQKWIKSGVQAKWEVVENTIYAENNLEKKGDANIDMTTLSVLYFDDKKFQPDWTNYAVSFEFNIVEGGFLVFGKFPIEGSASGILISTHKGLFSPNNWYKAEVTVTPDKISINFSEPNISMPDEQIDKTLKGFFGFGVLPNQKVFLRNIKLRFIK